MKFYLTLPVVLLTSCVSINYDPFSDTRITQTTICQSSLKTLVENNAFLETKSLVDRECNNIVVKGWVKGKINNAFDRRCKASFQYLQKRPALQKVAKAFIQNECYAEKPNKFYWTSNTNQ
ncbi:hypothetical protein [Algibacillus agarilyticus]|uniref:hypothetical protein n=1 Tax=Algibacillus agarilyticus TaxID=2234133 RepID=UPI000DD0D969|nr:hypothetical protein [Algibacillus agarilyticus]